MEAIISLWADQSAEAKDRPWALILRQTLLRKASLRELVQSQGSHLRIDQVLGPSFTPLIAREVA
jgi:hypothetical protein